MERISAGPCWTKGCLTARLLGFPKEGQQFKILYSFQNPPLTTSLQEGFNQISTLPPVMERKNVVKSMGCLSICFLHKAEFLSTNNPVILWTSAMPMPLWMSLQLLIFISLSIHSYTMRRIAVLATIYSYSLHIRDWELSSHPYVTVLGTCAPKNQHSYMEGRGMSIWYFSLFLAAEVSIEGRGACTAGGAAIKVNMLLSPAKEKHSIK